MSETKATRNVVVCSEVGIHVRAADLIAKLVRQFDAKVTLAKDGRRVEGTDVLQILSLGAAGGEKLLLEAVGHDAEEALDSLAQLLEGSFNEDGGQTETTENRRQ